MDTETKTAKASIKNLNIAPRKVRLVTDSIKGQPVEEALARLQMLSKRSSGPIAKLLRSGIANAREAGLDSGRLIIENITVDKGRVLKRGMSRGRGRVTLIEKKQSHVNLVLKEEVSKKRPAFVIHQKPKKIKKPSKEKAPKEEKPKYGKENEEDSKKGRKKSGFVKKFFQRKSV